MAESKTITELKFKSIKSTKEVLICFRSKL